MFMVYHSNQLDLLLALLVERIKQAPLASPFAKEQILVQSPGMAQWLKLELAKAFGIAANIEFPLPASFIWQMFTQVLSDVPKQSPYNKNAMSWQLMCLLPSQLDKPEFAPLAGYLNNPDKGDDDQPDQVRLWQLCQKIADIFDQYLVYRPDWISQWEQGQGLAAELAMGQGQAWQPILWRELVARTLALAPSGYHRANLYDDFIDQLQHAKHLPGQLPTRVFVFGISALPPRYVDALQALGQREGVDVHLFVTNPCRHYWGDIIDRKTLARFVSRQKGQLDDGRHSGNPLLASMGKLGRDYLDQLMVLPVPQIDAFVDIDAQDSNGYFSLLKALQRDVLELDERGVHGFSLSSSRHKSPIALTDCSLQVHACHSAMRELEVLHDQLLALFAQDPSLTPKDVVVMMPDVNSYSPYIQAVFGARGQIPFAVSDRAASQESPLLQSFLLLLGLPQSRFSASQLLAILEVPAVLRRFALSDEQFNQLRVWVQESGIRWGLDEHYPERFALPPLTGNSWLFGLQRMLMGFAMGAGEAVADILPYEEIEGQQGVVLGKLAWFVDCLAQFLPRLQQAQSLSQWSECLQQLLACFYQPDEQEERQLQLIRELLVNWQNQLAEARFSQAISPALLLNYLSNGLAQQRSSQRFLAGQVNFCTLMPMRSIPFKQVCLLGMNDGVYPRSLAAMGFDLMALAPRRGDRSRRDDDRYLFLEALLSAQQGIYISYQGFSVQDNSLKVPSVLLAELLDYLQQGFVLAGDEDLPHEQSAARLLSHVQLAHPLTPYSRDYFFPSAKSRLFTYANDWLPALHPQPRAANFQRNSLALPPEWGKEQGLELSELLRFYRQPAKYFLNRRLKVWFETDEPIIEESEPFELDALAQYQLKQGLLNCHLYEGSSDAYRRQLQLAGRLPQGWFGSLLLDELDGQMAQLAARAKPWITTAKGEKIAHEINLPFAQGQLQGWLDCEHRGLLHVKPGTFNGKDLLQAWLAHLCLSLTAHPLPTLLIDNKQSWQLAPLAADEARPLLAALLALWEQGMQRPLPFFPKTAWQWLTTWQKDPARADKAAQTCFMGGWVVIGEGQDPYVARCFPELTDALLGQLQDLAHTHLGPLMSQLKELA